MPAASRRARLLALATVLALIAGIVLVGLVRPWLLGRVGDLTPPGLPAEPADAEVLLAVGDIGDCDAQGDEGVASLASRLPGDIALLGDIAYDDGSVSDYQNCFDPAWGSMRPRFHPTPGNHEYQTRDASGYFDYFGTVAGAPGEGWYSYELGAWHVVALNANCGAVGGCDAGSPQLAWLEQDLAAHPADCLLAYWHQPRYSSGPHGNDEATEALWTVLADAGLDVALAAHNHSYERLRIGQVTEFVVGTGGRSPDQFDHPALSTTEVRHAGNYALLWLALGEGRYEWQFLPLGATSFSDAGSGSCRSG